MIRLKKVLFMTVLSSILMFPRITVCAEENPYVETDYDFMDSSWLMDNIHPNSADITLHVLTQNTAEYKTFKRYYKFDCYSDLLPEAYGGCFWAPEGASDRSASFVMEVYTPNGKEFDKIGEDIVFTYTCRVNSGVYTFAFPNGNNDISAITRDFQSPFAGDGKWTEDDVFDFELTNYEFVTINEGDSIRIYAVSGDTAWQKEIMPEFIKWAKEQEGYYEDRAEGKITYITEAPATPKPAEIVSSAEETSKPAVVTIAPAVKPSSEPLKLPKPEEKSSPVLPIAAGSAVVAAAGCFIYFKKVKTQ